MLISIIIPAYNAEQTISITIEDILKQTYSSFELILVNDGSTDKTLNICEEYSKSDSRVRVIDQENSGVSYARNNGVSLAKGQYITFVDADDRLDKEYLAFLMKALQETGADFAMGGVDRIKENEEIKSDEQRLKYTVISQKAALSEVSIGKIFFVGPWCKLGPRDFYLKHPFPDGKWYEDLANTYKIIMEAEKVALVNNILYHYVMRGGSTTGKKKTSIKQCLDYRDAIADYRNDILKVYPDLLEDVSVLTARDKMALYLCINRCTDPENPELRGIKEEITEWIKRNWRMVVRNKKAPVSVRLRVLLFALNPVFYEMMYYQGIKFKGKKIS